MSRSLLNSIGVATLVLVALALLVWIARAPVEHLRERTVVEQKANPNATVTPPDLTPVALATPNTAPSRVAATSIVMSPRADAPDPGAVNGHVTDEDGRPIAGVSLRLEPRFGRVSDGATDADGDFTFAGLRLEEVVLRTFTDDYVPVHSSILLTNEEPRATLDLVLVKACRLRIVLESHDGTSLPSDSHPDAPLIRFVDVRFTRQRPEIGSEFDVLEEVTSLMPHTAGEDFPTGVWRTVVAPGRRNLFACLVLWPWVLDVEPVPLEADSIVLVADIDRIRPKLGHFVVTVVDEASRESIQGARVERFDWKGGLMDLLATTDERGRCRGRDQLPGKNEIVIAHDGYLSTRVHCNLASGVDTDLGLIRLSRGIELTGRVEYEDGSSGRTRLRCRRVEFMDGDTDPADDKSVTCESDGTFRFAGLHPGQYMIGSAATTHPPGRDHNESSETGHHVNVDASNGSVSGLVLRLPHADRVDRIGEH